jgi:hypothetical protein
MATLNQASSSNNMASKLAMLSSLGADRSEFTEAPLMNAVELAAGEFITRVKENMQQRDLIVTGKIADIRIETEGNKINIYGHGAVLWQDRGVNGSETQKYNTPHAYTDKMPPSYVFEDYIRTKNIQLRHNENYDKDGGSPFADMDGDDKAIKSAAYAMAVKIYKDGFKPQKFFAIEIPKLYEDIKAAVPTFMLDQIKQQITAKLADQLFTGKK